MFFSSSNRSFASREIINKIGYTEWHIGAKPVYKKIIFGLVTFLYQRPGVGRAQDSLCLL